MAVNPIKVRFDEENFEHLEQKALRNGRPITSVINREIAACRSYLPLKDFFDAVDHPEIFRLKSSSTGMEVQRLSTLIRSGTLINLAFGAKECELNGRALVGYAELSGIVVLFDNLNINHAREPRIREVEELMKTLSSIQLKCPISLIKELVKPTNEDTLERAWAYYNNLPVTPFDLKEFLKLIAPTQSHHNILSYLPDDGYCVLIEEKSSYGRDELIFKKCYRDSSSAEEQFQKLLEEGTEDSGGKYGLSLNVYGRPEKYSILLRASR